MLKNQLTIIWQRLLHIVTVLDYRYALEPVPGDLMQDRFKTLVILQEEQELHVKSAVIS